MSKTRFKLDDRVTVQDRETLFHTRTQSYCRGKTGVVVNIRPKWVIPEDEAWGKWDEPAATKVQKFETSGLEKQGRVEQFYIVRFTMQELWAPEYGGSPLDTLETELYDSWLEPAK